MYSTIKKKISSKLILGTAQFGDVYGISNKSGVLRKSEASKILKFSINNNIRYLDTSNEYKGIKKILEKSNLKNWKISMKISRKIFIKSNDEKKFNLMFFKILKSLKQKKFEYFLFHHSSDLISKDGNRIYKFLLKLKRRGLINKIGVSAYSPNEIKKVLNKYRIDVVQLPFNVFDQRLNNKNFLKKLKSMNIEIHARSIFLQGLLLLKEKELPRKFIKSKPHFKKWYNFLKRNNANALEECLKFVISNPNIDKYVIGVNSLADLKGILLSRLNFTKQRLNSLKSNNLNLIDPRNW
tara:strand:- start:13479 stop:14366 length:888 start_codon:yes stop_codon:yes gene_type:complete